MKKRRLYRPTTNDGETIKSYRTHADNVSRIIAAGLAADQTKGRIRQAIDLYFDVAQAHTEEYKGKPRDKPTIEIDRG